MTAEIDCGGEQHRITWRRGRLVLEDHDVLAERALAALGSPLPVCVEALDAWREVRGTELLEACLLHEDMLSPAELAVRRTRHEAVTTEKGRGPSAMQVHLAGRFEEVEARVADKLKQREDRLWKISLIEALPLAVRRALALSVIVGFTRRSHVEEDRRGHGEHVDSALRAIVLPLLEQSARRWNRTMKPWAGCTLETWLLTPGEEPTCAAWVDRTGAHAVLSLPVSWLIDVWVRGIALVDDCLVLEVTGGSRDETALEVTALRWERQGRATSRSVEAPANVTRTPRGDWRLWWK